MSTNTEFFKGRFSIIYLSVINRIALHPNNNVLPRVFFLSSEYDEFVFRAKRDRLFLRRRDDDDDYCE